MQQQFQVVNQLGELDASAPPPLFGTGISSISFWGPTCPMPFHVVEVILIGAFQFGLPAGKETTPLPPTQHGRGDSRNLP